MAETITANNQKAPRQKRRAQQQRPALAAKPAAPAPIQPDAIYSRAQASAATGFGRSTLIRSENAGQLRGRNVRGRRYYLGADLLAWLKPESKEKS